MKNYNLYIVGGYVRDQILGVKSKDIDYAFEFTSESGADSMKNWSPEACYGKMNAILQAEGFEIFLLTSDCFTTRARFPKGHEHEGTTADFVMCRKEEYLNPKSRIPKVSMGTLYDDLYRRDFTMNAIAIGLDGEYIDPFGGIEDIAKRIIRCPKDAEKSFSEDYLRMLRAIRFSITKGFQMNDDIFYALQKREYWDNMKNHVSLERIREEIYRCMKHNTVQTIRLLSDLEEECGNILNSIFKDGLWLKPTNEK